MFNTLHLLKIPEHESVNTLYVYIDIYDLNLNTFIIWLYKNNSLVLLFYFIKEKFYVNVNIIININKYYNV